MYTVRHLERLAIGTSYLDVAARVARPTRDIRGTNKCELVVDATGIGSPVVDVLREAALQRLYRDYHRQRSRAVYRARVLGAQTRPGDRARPAT